MTHIPAGGTPAGETEPFSCAQQHRRWHRDVVHGVSRIRKPVPSVNVAVINDAGEILMIRRAGNGNWALPGGAINLGESVA